MNLECAARNPTLDAHGKTIRSDSLGYLFRLAACIQDTGANPKSSLKTLGLHVDRRIINISDR